MDIIFALATIDKPISVEQHLTLVDDNKRVLVPAIHDRVSTPQELAELKDILHKRIDSIFESIQNKGKIKKPKKTRKEIFRVFNCFGREPEIIEIEI